MKFDLVVAGCPATTQLNIGVPPQLASASVIGGFWFSRRRGGRGAWDDLDGIEGGARV